MIKLKELLNEQGKTKTVALAGIVTKYPKILASIFITRSSQEALVNFAENTKKEVGIAFDQFVDKYGKRNVKNRGKLKAGFGQLPATQEPGKTPPPQNDAFNLDLKQQFGDDQYKSQTLQSTIESLLGGYRKSKINELKKQYPNGTVEIGLVNYTIISTTSKVPSTKFAGKGGNAKLAELRASEMKSAFAAAGQKLNFPGYPGDPNGSAVELSPNEKEIGEQGPKYVKDDAKYGPRGNRNALYQSTFARNRKSYIKVTVEIRVSFPEVPGKEIPGEKNETYMFSLRKKPSIKITIPPIRLGKPGTGLFSTKVPKPGKCPALGKNKKIKTNMGRM